MISYADPKNLKQVGDFVTLPSGHTSSCIQDCRYIWTGGPARRSDQDWLGPIINRGPGPASAGSRGSPAADFMHNSGRPTDGSVRASGVKSGNILIGTEEDFQPTCGDDGRIVSVDLTDSWGGEPAQRSTRANPYRLKALDSFHPLRDTPETTDGTLEGCSAHYFEIEGPMLAAAFYNQGLRLLDIHDARDLDQVGFYRVTTPAGGDPAVNPTSNSWDTAFRSDRKKGDLVYLFDMNRGVEVLRLKQGADAAAKMKSRVRNSRYSSKPVAGLARTASGGFVCPLFTTS